MEPYVEQFKELVGMLLEEYPPSAFIALGVWIGSFFLQMPLMSKNLIYNGGRKKMIAAEKAGRVVYARLQHVHSNYHHNDSGQRDVTYFGRYSYVVDGKKYYKALKSGFNSFDESVKLYYPSNPVRAKTAGELMFWDRKILPMIVPFVLAALTLWVLGYPIV